jgi:hypothetical protein
MKAAGSMVKKAGEMVCVHLRRHNLRRHAATYVFRAGVPIEILSNGILIFLQLRCAGLRLVIVKP